MSHLCGLPLSSLILAAGLALPPVGLSLRAQERPQLSPTRDVDIVYEVTRPKEPKISERVRWLASEGLERIDGPDKSTTIFNRGAHEITLVTPANRTYRKLDGEQGRPPAPATDAVLKRGDDAVIAGLHCVDWSWADEVEMHTVCATADGVLLRHVVDGQIVRQARSVRYGQQDAELFQVPPDYAPALAPEGSLGP
jgi:hypothetical protein